MPRRLPSLTALRSFEAAARHLSFATAAKELFVTPAAVGFQIKQLEEELGGTLFLRKHRAVEITDRGRALLRELTPAFHAIQGAWNAAHDSCDATILRVTGPAKAIHSWVLPALAAAPDGPPGLRISWDFSKQMRDVQGGEVDLAIRWALRPEGDLHWTPLLRTRFTPLVRPDVARYVEGPADLAKHGLIGVEFILDSDRPGSVWEPWYRVNDLEPPRNFAVTCADKASAVDTAIATGHVAIAGSFLAHAPLARGDLVAPFDTAIAPRSRFWLVCRKGFETTAEHSWILSAIRAGSAGVDAGLAGMRLFHPDGSVAAG